jgi:hypothetical protein
VNRSLSSLSPFRPVSIRAIYDELDENTVIVMWDGLGTAVTP